MNCRIFCIVLLLLALQGFAGCGQKGALYLPQPDEPVPTEQDGDSE